MLNTPETQQRSIRNELRANCEVIARERIAFDDVQGNMVMIDLEPAELLLKPSLHTGPSQE